MPSIATVPHLTPKACLPLILSIKRADKQGYINDNWAMLYGKQAVSNAAKAP